MKKKLCLIVLLLTSCASVTETQRMISSSGDRKGNGGGAWVCSKGDKIISAESLDLFEAKNLWKKELISKGLTFDAYIDFIKDKIKESNFGKSLIAGDKKISDADFDEVIRRLVPIENSDKKIGLNDSNDVSPLLKQKGCEYKQVITYLDGSSVLYDKEIYNSLDNLSRAALITHEVIAKYLREEDGEKNTIRARRIVGELFSKQSEISFGISNEFNANNPKDMSCGYSNDFMGISPIAFKVSPKFNNYFRLNFTKMSGKSLPWPEYIDIPRRVFDFDKFPSCVEPNEIPRGYTERDGCNTRQITGVTQSNFEAGENYIVSYKRPKNKNDAIKIFVSFPRLNILANLECDKNSTFWELK